MNTAKDEEQLQKATTEMLHCEWLREGDLVSNGLLFMRGAKQWKTLLGLRLETQLSGFDGESGDDAGDQKRKGHCFFYIGEPSATKKSCSGR